jgi:nucleotide-binding universal stress UspA family protein
MKLEKVVIAVDLDETSLRSLSQIKNFPLPQECEIHLVHVFELNFMSFDILPNIEPSPEDYLLIQKVIEEKLLKVKGELSLTEHKNVLVKCLFGHNARQEFLKYAEETGASLIVAASKDRQGFAGLFESSFTTFLNKFSKTNLLILRPVR